MIKLLIFDWGGTVMVDYASPGPMYLWERVDWVGGARESLSSLVTLYTMVVATNAPHSGTEEMKKALDRVGAEKYFSAFFSSKELAYGKPDPRFFLTIAQRMKVQPGECVMIGNHYAKDIVGAKAAGMRTVFYNAKRQPDKFPEADMVITDMSALPEAVRMMT